MKTITYKYCRYSRSSNVGFGITDIIFSDNVLLEKKKNDSVYSLVN